MMTTESPLKARKTYPQEWREYNQAQVNEKSRFLELLHELCAGIDEPVQTFGRPRLSFADMLFCVVFKVYAGVSSRRFSSDLRDAQIRGLIDSAPHFNSVCNYLEDEELTPYLKRLIAESSLPMRAIEEDFAVDSSGFATGGTVKWMHQKYSKPHFIDKADWVKCHLMCGVTTNVVTAVEISDRHANDHPFFKPLVEATRRNFVMNEVSADKAYLSNGNLLTVVKAQAMPYIPFKSNSKGNDRKSTDLWRRMFHYYSYHQEDFMRRYHKRSNVETTFSMIKAKFGERLRSKSKTAQINEVLCKVLCHNVCCLIQSIYELGVEPTFWAE